MTILVSYDVEAASVGEAIGRIKDGSEKYPESMMPESTVEGLEIITELHSKHEVPATLFFTGKTLLQSLEAAEKTRSALGKLVDIQQHTFSHVMFKDVLYEPSPGEKIIYKAPPISLLEPEVRLASEVLRDYLKVDCKGIRTPFCYFNGLRGETQLLEMLTKYGMKFVSSFGRNEQGAHPTPWVQPYNYAEDGFNDLIELPIQSWFDVIWYDVNGWENYEDFKKLLRSNIDYVHANGLVWGVVFHDWVVVKAKERERKVIDDFLGYAKSKGEEFYTNFEFSEIFRRQQGAA